MKLWIDKGVWTGHHAELKAAAILKEEVKKVGVIKHAALGDLILTRPFFITLKEYFPKCHLTLSVISNYQKGIPYDLIDAVHVVNKDESSWYGFYKNYLDFGSQDILFDITATTPSFWLTYLNKAQLKVGYKHKGIERIIYDVAVPRSCYKLEAETFLDQLLVLGLSYQWPLKFNLEGQPAPQLKPYIAFFTTASTPQKCWPWQYFKELIKILCMEFETYDHIILSGLADWEITRSRTIYDDLQPRANLKWIKGGEGTYNYIQHADLIVSADTGIRNLAIAADTATVGIFFNTQPFRYLPRFGQHRAVYTSTGEVPEVEQVRSAVFDVLTKIMSKKE